MIPTATAVRWQVVTYKLHQIPKRRITSQISIQEICKNHKVKTDSAAPQKSADNTTGIPEICPDHKSRTEKLLNIIQVKNN